MAVWQQIYSFILQHTYVTQKQAHASSPPDRSQHIGGPHRRNAMPACRGGPGLTRSGRGRSCCRWAPPRPAFPWDYLRPFPLRSGRRRGSQLGREQKAKQPTTWEEHTHTQLESASGCDCESRESEEEEEDGAGGGGVLVLRLLFAAAVQDLPWRGGRAALRHGVALRLLRLPQGMYVLSAMRIHRSMGSRMLFSTPFLLCSALFCDVYRIHSFTFAWWSQVMCVRVAPAVCSQGMRAEMVRREGQHHLRDLPSGLSNWSPNNPSRFICLVHPPFLTVLSVEGSFPCSQLLLDEKFSPSEV